MPKIVAPKDLFELAPQIMDISKYPYPGAMFPAFKFMNVFSIMITFRIPFGTMDHDIKLTIDKEVTNLEKIKNMDLSSYGIQGTVEDISNLSRIETSLNNTTIKNAFKQTEALQDKLKNPVDTTQTIPSNCNSQPPFDTGLVDSDGNPIVKTDITNLSGEVVSTVESKVSDTIQSCDNSGESIKKTILDGIPEVNMDAFNSEQLKDPLCQLPEDNKTSESIKQAVTKANLATDTSSTDVNDVLDEFNSLQTETENKLKKYFNNNQDIQTSDEYYQQNVALPENEDLKYEDYGIPLLVLNPELNIIINIVDNELRVLNFNQVDSAISPNPQNQVLKIDTSLNPDAKILEEITYTLVYSRNYNSHTLELRREFSDVVFTDTAVNPVDTGVFYLGMDKAGLKFFCGRIYTAQIFENEQVNLSSFIESNFKFNTIPGALGFYDFYNRSDVDPLDTRIYYNKVYPYQSKLLGPISMTSNYELLPRLNNNYTFMNHGVIDNIFCKNNMLKNDFTIMLWIKKHPYSNRFKTIEYNRSQQYLIHDAINNNYVFYDEMQRSFYVQFFGHKEHFDYVLNNNEWYLISFKLNRFEKKVTLNILSLRNPSDLTSVNLSSFDIVLDIPDEELKYKEFNLTSIYGEYNHEAEIHNKIRYINKFNCVSGPIIFFNHYQPNILEEIIYQTHYKVLREYVNIGIDRGIV